VIDNIEAVTVEEVQNLATTLFKPEQASLTLLGVVDKDLDLDNLITF
jgi:predicted Zn-dependent peptidase